MIDGLNFDDLLYVSKLQLQIHTGRGVNAHGLICLEHDAKLDLIVRYAEDPDGQGGQRGACEGGRRKRYSDVCRAGRWRAGARKAGRLAAGLGPAVRTVDCVMIS